jgi:hypothetical protein
MALKHLLIRNPRLIGWEYGMLRAFEEEIIRQTDAAVSETPYYGLPVVLNRIGHGMRWDPARAYLPKKELEIDEVDVLWYVLMGPENHELDLFKSWSAKAKHRIVYLYDTLAPQFSLMQKLFSGNDFNIRITSFSDAVPHLEKLTGQRWHAVEQAVPAGLFTPVPAEKKIIDFSSYGRRFPVFHQALLEFCKSNGLYYDYTMHAVKNPTAPEDELYRQYAWHLTHSKFTVSWPVELTNPVRAGIMHPITCRWFEAAASSTVIIGRKPGNDQFGNLLAEDLVTEINPFDEKAKILQRLDQIYANFHILQSKADEVELQNRGKFTWENRVKRILQLLPVSQP